MCKWLGIDEPVEPSDFGVAEVWDPTTQTMSRLLPSEKLFLAFQGMIREQPVQHEEQLRHAVRVLLGHHVN